MLYRLLQFSVRMGLHWFARNVIITNHEVLKTKGPLLVASNHPNSFMDALLVGAYMKYPVHFITRGDVFKKAWIRKLLHLLNMIPIYRIRDGKEMLSLNEETFLKSVEVLRSNGILLIFVEGFCAYQTTLQLPLKKGAPRILQSCWQQGIEARILPLWLQYSSFFDFPKTIHIAPGDVFDKSVVDDINSATCFTQINAVTESHLLRLAAKVPASVKPLGIITKALLFLPSMLGAVVHAPFYLPVQGFVKAFNKHHSSMHYDSMMFAILLLGYPIYLLLIALVCFTVAGSFWAAALPIIIMPLLALCYTHWKS